MLLQDVAHSCPGAYMQFNKLKERAGELSFVGNSDVSDQSSVWHTVGIFLGFFLKLSQCSESTSFHFYLVNDGFYSETAVLSDLMKS